MKKILFAFLPLAFLSVYPVEAQPSLSSPPTKVKVNQTSDEGVVFFTPPPGWYLADANALPKLVQVMVVGKGPSNFPPSMNLCSEPYKGTLKQYLKTIKNINASQGFEWKDLGTIQTQAGPASLSQVDTKSQWGDVRLMHVILVKNGYVYILTASALTNEFSMFYKDFFVAMRSLRIANDLYEMVINSQQRTQLKSAANKLQSQWHSILEQKQKENPAINPTDIQEFVFKSEEFQNTIWNPFKEMLKQKYNQLGAEWQSLFLQKLEDQLFSKTLINNS